MYMNVKVSLLENNKMILVTGGSGMVGNSLKKIIPNAFFISSENYDLKSDNDTRYMFKHLKPKKVIHLAARVGGVKANSEQLGQFYTDNILINTNVLHYSMVYKVDKVLSLLSTCIYPDKVNYPLTEEQIHNGPPHVSNFAYAYAKRMLDVQSKSYRQQYGCNFITAVPNNLFGEHDNFDLNNSHVIPAMIRKMYDAKNNNQDVVLWGDGTPLREFTYSKDLAQILLFLLDSYNGETPINIGNNKEYSIKQIAEIIANKIEFNGQIVWDTTKPNGQFKKPSDNSKLINLGFDKNGYTNINSALTNVCNWYRLNYPNIRGI
jgi:GDP-L-fucose synthase